MFLVCMCVCYDKVYLKTLVENILTSNLLPCYHVKHFDPSGKEGYSD